MHAQATASSSPSRFAVWRSLEQAADRYASYAALGLGLTALAAVLVLH